MVIALYVNRRSLEEVDYNSELKQQRRRRLRKRHLKSEVALLQTLSRLFHLVQFVKCWQMFVEFNFKRRYQSSGKEKWSRCLVFTSSTKREIRHFHFVVVQRRQRRVQKKNVMHVSANPKISLDQKLTLKNPLPILHSQNYAAGIRGWTTGNLHIVLNSPKNPYLNQATQKILANFPTPKFPESKF